MWYYWCKLLWNWSVHNIYNIGVNHFRLVFGVSLFSRELRWHDQQNVCSTKSSNHWSVIIEYINFRLPIKCIYTIYDDANLAQLVSNFSLLQHRDTVGKSVFVSRNRFLRRNFPNIEEKFFLIWKRIFSFGWTFLICLNFPNLRQLS